MLGTKIAYGTLRASLCWIPMAACGVRDRRVAMRVRAGVAALFGLILAGCGGGREGSAVDACVKEIAEKLQGKTYELDKRDMAAHVKAESSDVVVISSTATFD